MEAALARRGWRVVASFAGNDYNISATWEVRRGGEARSVYLNFDGMMPEGDGCQPMEKSYGCMVEGRGDLSLYFRRINASRDLWESELEAFVRSLDGVE